MTHLAFVANCDIGFYNSVSYCRSSSSLLIQSGSSLSTNHDLHQDMPVLGSYSQDRCRSGSLVRNNLWTWRGMLSCSYRTVMN